MPNQSPLVSSAVGLKHLVFAPLVVDNDNIAAYGELRRLKGAVEVEISPANADPEVIYVDDYEYASLYPDPELSVTIRVIQLPLLFQQLFFGGAIDNNGVLIENAQRKAYYFAIGFMVPKANGKNRYVWLYKCRAKPLAADYATKQGKTVDRKLAQIEFVALKLNYSHEYQAIADDDIAPSSVGKTFLSAVYNYPGEYSLLLDDVTYAVSESGTTLVLDSDPSATYSVSDSGTAIVITTE